MNQNASWVDIVNSTTGALKNGLKLNVIVGIDSPTAMRLLAVVLVSTLFYLVMRIYVFPKN